MSDLNRQIKAILPHLAGPAAKLLASMPRRQSRSLLMPSIVGIAGAGVLAGVAIGLLIAPQNGKEMRKQLSSAASSFRSEVVSSLNRIASAETESSAETDEPTTQGSQATSRAAGSNNNGGAARRSSNRPRA